MSHRNSAPEVRRAIEKVSEGIEMFDKILDEVYNSPYAAQREEFEDKLKKVRQQIRAWVDGDQRTEALESMSKHRINGCLFRVTNSKFDEGRKRPNTPAFEFTKPQASCSRWPTKPSSFLWDAKHRFLFVF